MLNHLILPLLLVVIGTAAAAAAGSPSLTATRGGGPARTFELQEWAVAAGDAYLNPFDPDEVAVDATFTAPDGRTLTLPAFWDDRPVGRGFFIRMTPDVPGAWRVTATVTDHAGTRRSAELAFAAVDGGHPGFVRVAGNHRYLRFDSGASYFPVGLNLCWPDGGSDPTWYDRTFDVLSRNGGNYARLWMCNAPFKLEGADTGLGRYSLPAAAHYDAVLDAADRRGVRVMLCFLNHREFLDHDMWGKAEWPALPYNAAAGGPATRPADVFTHPAARRAFRNRLRYIVARYAAYTSVGFWELFNEQENARVPIPTAWNAEMSAYLAKIDPYHHLITTSAVVPDGVWQLPDVGLTQAHVYGDGTQVDLMPSVQQATRDHERFGKPFLVGEMGLDFQGPDVREDPTGTGTALHNSLWGGLASGSCGTAMYWWWDNYVGPKDLWHTYAPVAAFARQVDWAGKDFRPIAVDDAYRTDATGDPVDLTIASTGGWGDTTRAVIVIPPGGQPRALPSRFVYGPDHKGLSQPIAFDLTVPPSCQLRLGIAEVSDCAVVRVSIDDRPARDFLFSALPGMPGVMRSQQRGERYQARVDQDFALDLPPGHHRVAVAVHAGDWVTLSHVTFTRALAARYADLSALAVQDATTSETVLWLRDTRSNWRADRDGAGPPANEANVEVVVPHVAAGRYVCRWFDTRTGRVDERRATAAAAGPLVLPVVPFTRDVALRLVREGP
jgi:hypothetical protein